MPWTYLIEDPQRKKIVEKLYKNQKTNQREFRVEKVIKKKSNKL